MTAHMSRAKDHLAALDGMRGVAAVMVVALHLKDLLGPVWTPHSAYLAVDFFFCLSGFVLCYAYRVRLDNGLSVRNFLMLRLIRLVPLFLCGMVLGLGIAVLTMALGRNALAMEARDSLVGVVGLVGLPAPAFRSSTALYPLNVAAWSLFLEMLANVVFAYTYKGLRWRVVLVGMAAALAAIVATTVQAGNLEGGNDWQTMPMGVARVCWSFPLGGVIFAVWSGKDTSRIATCAWTIYPVLAVLLFVDVPNLYRPIYDLGCVCIAFPLIVLVAASRTGRSKSAAIERSLGKASYAIYITHLPAGFVYAACIARIMRVSANQLAPWAGLVFIPLMYVLALLLDRHVDIPIRELLLRRHRAAQLPPASARA